MATELVPPYWECGTVLETPGKIRQGNNIDQLMGPHDATNR
jgi:hypothetical protein